MSDDLKLAIGTIEGERIEVREPKEKPDGLTLPRPLIRSLGSADPFPIHALGDVLAPAAEAIHIHVQAPQAICGQAVLAAATLAVQGHADIELPTQQRRPLTNFFVTVAGTGERKTAVDTEALWPVRKREAALRNANETDRAEYANSKLAWDKARDSACKSGKGDRSRIKSALDALGPAPKPPLEPLLVCPEPTYEGLCKLLAQGHPSVGIFANEGGQFIGGYGMADDAKLRTAAGPSAAWDGEPIKRVRAGEGLMFLPGRRVTMHLMAQPDVAGALLSDPLLANQGLLSRFLITAPPPASGTRRWFPPQSNSRTAVNFYLERLLGILEYPMPLVAGSQNELAPRPLRLTRDAEELWIAFYQHVESLLGPGGELAPVGGLANKLPEHAARIAGVLTLVEDIQADEVPADEMKCGIELSQHYVSEALRLYGARQISERLLEAERLRLWLSSWPHETIRLQDIYQRGPTSIRDAAAARAAATILVDHGWLTPIHAVSGGARCRDLWSIARGSPE